MQISEIMTECCGSDKTMDLAKMKSLMERFGKATFNEPEIEQMEKYCADAMPDFDKIASYMEMCGCKSEKDDIL